MGVLGIALVFWVWTTLALVEPTSALMPMLVSGTVALVAVLAAGLLLLVSAFWRRTPLMFRWVALGGFLLTTFVLKEASALSALA
jgi:hypothetical protein